MRRLGVVRGAQQGAAARGRGPVLLLGARGAGEQFVAEVLAVVGVGVEHPVHVQPFRPLWTVRGARPLDAVSFPQRLVAHAGVVARPAGRAALPLGERLGRRGPPGQRPARAGAKAHPPRVVQPGVQVAAGLPGRGHGLLGQVHGAVGVGERAGLLAPQRRGQHHVGQFGGLGEVGVGDHHEHRVTAQDPAHPVEVGQGHGRVGPGDPQQPHRALLGVAEDLHGVGGRPGVRDGLLGHVPQLGQFAHVPRVGPVAKPRQVAVGPALPGVLGGGLAVHLQHAAAGPAQHAAQQVQVVHLAGRGGGLVGLVDALQHGGQHALAGAEHLGGGQHVPRGHPADVGDPPGRVVRDDPGQLVQAEGVRGHPVVVHPAPVQHLAQQPVEQRQVRARPHRQVHVGVPGHLGAPRVHAHQPRPVRAGQPVQHPRPQHGLRLGGVVAVQHQRVAVVHVRVAGGLAVGAEALLERGVRGGRAQPGVAVHVRGAQPGLADHRERVVLLQQQLARGVEGVRQRPPPVQQLPGARHHPVHGRVPVARHQLAALGAHQRCGQPVALLALPAVQPLGAQSTPVDPVAGLAAHAHHPAVGHADPQTAPVAAQHARRGHPLPHLVGGHPGHQVLVHPRRPVPARRIRGAPAPRVGDAVRHHRLLAHASTRARTSKVNRFSATSTRTCWPGSSWSRISNWARWLSTSRWITRRSGRAPNSGW